MLARTKRLTTSLYKDEDKAKLYKIRKIKAFLLKAIKVKTISEIDALEMGLAVAILKDRDVKVNVPILKLYEAAVNDTVYRQ